MKKKKTPAERLAETKQRKRAKKAEPKLRDGDRIDYAQLGRFGFGEANNCALALEIGDGFFLSASGRTTWDIQTTDDGYGLYLRDIPAPQTYGELRIVLCVLGVMPKA